MKKLLVAAFFLTAFTLTNKAKASVVSHNGEKSQLEPTNQAKEGKYNFTLFNFFSLDNNKTKVDSAKVTHNAVNALRKKAKNN